MIKFIKEWICKIFKIKSCKCNDMDEHAEYYLKDAEREIPLHVEETAKQKKIRLKHKGSK
tara:strand:+ start:119 stop:298 length:180 start_codon:yes stop_codon:yes gene_type:complete